MSTSHTDLEFSFLQNLTIIRLKYFKVSRKIIDQKPRYKFLRTYYLIDYADSTHNTYTLNEKGRMYLRYKHRSSVRYWIPVIISILALFAGYDVLQIPIIEKCLQAIANILKSIAETLGTVS